MLERPGANPLRTQASGNVRGMAPRSTRSELGHASREVNHSSWEPHTTRWPHVASCSLRLFPSRVGSRRGHAPAFWECHAPGLESPYPHTSHPLHTASRSPKCSSSMRRRHRRRSTYVRISGVISP
jgi:hypothetical protein